MIMCSYTSVLCLPSGCMYSLGQEIFFLCCATSLPCKVRSSNTLTSVKSSSKYCPFKLCVCVCVYVCVCMCMHVCGCMQNKLDSVLGFLLSEAMCSNLGK